MDLAGDWHVPRPSSETRGYWGSEKDVGPRGGRGRTQGPHDFTSGPIANEEFRWGGGARAGGGGSSVTYNYSHR